MTGRRTDGNRKPPLSWKRKLNLAVTVLVLCLGPIMIGVGSFMINADEELARSGVQATGTIIRFDDVTKASERRMQVQFPAADGAVHRTFAAVDHDQYPVVGSSVTVVYAENNPGRAIVPGYESDGVWLRGAGVVLTVIFGVLGLLYIVLVGSAVLRARLRRRRTPKVV
ncbi:DUF3592 domain-containing protein [Pseudarthrobacter sp. NIBRBAC000502770]|uniref:DUF3592 domain-containing protein n=1 Tax=Pseudarthrobacter sp. NIBRBAC000502770 TaxID=2590785 RepID=UPI0011405545|nr:DUF3592 domain-containing protein [Pseudarthrobacter sp. NIBRBAC000502770]QDG87443.1 DUF3592 domain-containing protein [Pseudarthrobacter sp. NIBRBAC000502770]